MTPRVGVLALQGDVREHLKALTLGGAEAVPVRRVAELDQVDALVLPGGESTTIDRLTRVFGMRGPLRRRIEEGMPVYGSCAGMIMLASELLDGHRDQQTLGGLDISVRRNAFGRQVDSFECDLSVDGLPEAGGAYHAVFIRAPWVERVGPQVRVLATVRYDGADHVVAVQQGQLLATSFHPEMTDDHRVHAYFVDLVRSRLREHGGSIGSRSADVGAPDEAYDDTGEAHR